MTQAAPAARPLATPTALAFSTIALPLGALAVAVAVYLPPHFSAHLGVPLATVGLAFATVLTLLGVPALYCLFYRVEVPR